MFNQITKDIKKFANPKKNQDLSRFFKTGKGEYGEGQKFLGVPTSEKRRISREYYKDASFADIQKLLESKFHDYRMVGVLILVDQFKRADDKMRKKIFNFYIKNAKRINNWDLVDVSAPHIGQYLLDKNTSVLIHLAKSKNLWERRISIMFTFAFIRKNRFEEIIKIADLLIQDEHDLIHKAVGWMLREVGKRDLASEEKFLKKHYKNMPRTMLRYSIEKFPENKRKKYLKNLA